jgi:hypothetical protein
MIWQHTQIVTYKSSDATHISHVERYLEAVDEAVVELGKEVQHVEQVVARHPVQIAIGERPHVAIRFAEGRVDARILAKDIVLACVSRKRVVSDTSDVA